MLEKVLLLIILFYNCIDLTFIYKKDVLILSQTLNFGGSCKLEIFKNNSNYIKSDTVILIIPGGAYSYVSNREGFPIMKRFVSYGYSGAVLTYKIGYGCYPENYNQGLKSIEYLSKKFKKIVLMGFSAGAHLAGILGTTERTKLPSVIGMILCYPVISFVYKPHIESAKNFLGDKYENIEIRKKFSIENRINKNTLPTFIWTTKEDQLVPYENTLVMIEKLKEYGVKYQEKIFEKGRHGLALADKTTMVNNDKSCINPVVAKWTKMADSFIEGLI